MVDPSGPGRTLAGKLPGSRQQLVGAVLAGLVAASLVGIPAEAITQDEVDEACADSADAYRDYRAARSQFQATAVELERANQDLDAAKQEEARIRSVYEARADQLAQLQDQVETQAKEMYVQAVSQPPANIAFLSNPAAVLSGLELLGSTSRERRETFGDLAATAAELERLRSDLQRAVDDFTRIRDQQAAETTAQEKALTAALNSYDSLDTRCRDLEAQYEAEQARLRAEAEERRRREKEARRRRAATENVPSSDDGRNAGSSGEPLAQIVCPFTPGQTQFIDSWGYPRSGGRTHKGTDLFAVLDEPVYAVVGGVIDVGNGGLGGKTIWLAG